jgi:DNA-binding beta-propeller fold protein YncE
MSFRPFLRISALGMAGLFTACSGASTSGPFDESPGVRQPARAVGTQMHYSAFPQSASPAIEPRSLGFQSPAKKRTTPILYEADAQNNAIQLYTTYTKNPTLIGTITQGIDFPANLTIRHGTLYVANDLNNTVTEYPIGSMSPSVTLSNQIVAPNGVAVDSKGTVYVTSGSVGSCYVLEFPKDSSTPATQVNGFNLPIGLAIDAHDNLYVSDAFAEKVYEVKKGTTSPVDLGLSKLADNTGIAFDRKDNLWVSNDAPQYTGSGFLFTVLGFKLGSTTAFATIANHCPYAGCSQGLDGPYALAIDRRDTIYVANSFNFPGWVASFKEKNLKLFETTSQGMGVPLGLALDPPLLPR